MFFLLFCCIENSLPIFSTKYGIVIVMYWLIYLYRLQNSIIDGIILYRICCIMTSHWTVSTDRFRLYWFILLNCDSAWRLIFVYTLEQETLNCIIFPLLLLANTVFWLMLKQETRNTFSLTYYASSFYTVLTSSSVYLDKWQFTSPIVYVICDRNSLDHSKAKLWSSPSLCQCLFSVQFNGNEHEKLTLIVSFGS